MLFRPVRHKLRISFEQDLYEETLHSVTDDLYHNWSQQVQIYSGPTPVAKPAVMQVMQCMTKNFPQNV
jgi:hypothetical protein